MQRKRHGFQFTLRALLVLVLVVSAALSAFTSWWTGPYVLTGTHPNGICAWEQWERRSVTGGTVHIRTIRYYTNGQKACEYSNGEYAYWSPQGDSVSGDEFFAYFLADGGERPQDVNSHRPTLFGR